MLAKRVSTDFGRNEMLSHVNHFQANTYSAFLLADFLALITFLMRQTIWQIFCELNILKLDFLTCKYIMELGIC